jgi:hypothetical protein
MRSLLALSAAIFFAYNALDFLPPGVILNEGALGGIDGEPAAVAVTWAARTLFIGLALLSLAMLEWSWINDLVRTRPAGS